MWRNCFLALVLLAGNLSAQTTLEGIDTQVTASPALMAITATIMMIWFWRKGWIGRRPAAPRSPQP